MGRRKKQLPVRKTVATLLLLPLLVWGVIQAGPLLTELAARAAMVSAYLTMPEGSLALLEERFNSELFGEGEKEDAVVSAPTPQKPAASSAPPVQGAEPAPSQAQALPPAAPPEESGPLPEPDSIPDDYRGEIKEVQYGADQSPFYIPLEAGYVKNSTKLDNEEVQEELDQPLALALEDTDAPQVLIIHTHATEAYEPYDVDFFDTRGTWRSTDDSYNMVQVGNRIAEQLTWAGIGVLHDTTQHDYPSYNGAYERSAETVKRYLEEYPTIKIVLDVHRDAIQPSDSQIVKSVAEINGRRAAQVMIITGCEDGTMGVPNWSDNLRFAATLQSTAEGLFPGLMRPIFFCYRKYNMDLTTGSILLEFGSHGNTLAQAEYSGELIGKALAQALGKPVPPAASGSTGQNGAAGGRAAGLSVPPTSDAASGALSPSEAFGEAEPSSSIAPVS